MTGFVDIALVSLAVLAAGAYLLRAGYRRWVKRGGACGGCGAKGSDEASKRATLTINGRAR
jgi:hypothetical protein